MRGLPGGLARLPLLREGIKAIGDSGTNGAASVLAWAKLTAGYEPEPMSRVIEISWDEVKQ